MQASQMLGYRTYF